MMELIIALYNTIWGFVNIYNYYPIIRSTISSKRSKNIKPQIKLDDEQLPTISILLPAYRETETLKECVKSLFEVDYPKEKLDVIVITENDDRETNKVVEELKKDYKLTHLIVEETAQPKGKPRALNQGLKYAKGEIIGVIDAEDIISKDLLRKAAYSIKVGGFDAIQAILDMTNDYYG
jgi:cellulose synthase/poly-beta-1,6-N-acetylglucosamine synthase-like glycosyltransferase